MLDQPIRWNWGRNTWTSLLLLLFAKNSFGL